MGNSVEIHLLVLKLFLNWRVTGPKLENNRIMHGEKKQNHAEQLQYRESCLRPKWSMRAKGKPPSLLTPKLAFLARLTLDFLA